MYSTYNLRESLVDPKNERTIGVSRETYIGKAYNMELLDDHPY